MLNRQSAKAKRGEAKSGKADRGKAKSAKVECGSAERGRAECSQVKAAKRTRMAVSWRSNKTTQSAQGKLSLDTNTQSTEGEVTI